ncbi:MAG: HAD family hydrolase [Oscillospiraceae bacterium]|nr:HAD family hydrolase [Oscillospiraceae bacterium]
MDFESLIFDIDGTLWDSRALVAEGYNRQLRAEGLDHLCTDAEALKPLFGLVMEDLADRLFAEIPAPERYELTLRCMKTENEYLHEAPCRIGYPGVRETLEQLRRRHRLFIVSNSNCGYPELCMEKLGIGQLFEGHLCFGDTGTPKGETIRTLMARHHISSACYIGDTQGDADAAKAAGIPFIWAAYGFGTPDAWDARLERFEDLVKEFKL